MGFLHQVFIENTAPVIPHRRHWISFVSENVGATDVFTQ